MSAFLRSGRTIVIGGYHALGRGLNGLVAGKQIRFGFLFLLTAGADVAFRGEVPTLLIQVNDVGRCGSCRIPNTGRLLQRDAVVVLLQRCLLATALRVPST